jgi:hypothetical protein
MTERINEPRTSSFDLFLTSNRCLKLFGASESTLSSVCSVSEMEGEEFLALL